MNTLVIRHIPDTEPPQFQVARGDQKSAKPVEVASPFGFPVKSRPNSDLIQELRWYLEEFLDYPFEPNTDRARHVLAAMETWGKKAFNDLFDTRDAGGMFDTATKGGYKNLCLQVMSDDADILQWPWEALLDPKAAYLAVSCQIERRLNEVRDPMDISRDLPTDQVNILLVTARPKKGDVGYRSISRPLVELIEKNNIPAAVHVLRPPTFENLRRHLKEQRHFYHLIHFDGHGGYGRSELAGDTPNRFDGPTGVLLFEDEKCEKNEVTAEQLSGLLRENAVPIMVLNACQSAMLDEQAKDPFASVAAALLKAGIRGVVAMSYSLYVSGAQEFLPAFYNELFTSGNLSAATRAGRQKMFGQMKRVCARGRYELKDFIVPVIYQQKSYDLPFAGKPGMAKAVEKIELPEEAKDEANPYGFIGRDTELLKLERAIRKDTPAVLIHGLGGIGKTTLASGFVRWLNDTGGMDGCFWLTFIDIRSAEYVINSMGSAIFGPNFLTAEIAQRIDALARALREHRLIVVWDNFEVAAGIEGTYVKANLSADDRQLLLSLLKKIRGGKTKVLITSRSDEDWLDIQRMKVSIGGLLGEERWEYCDKILDNLGLEVDREDEDQVELMNLLEGHPLAMRVILPKMEKMPPGQIITALKSNIKALGIEHEKLYATLRFTEDQLTDDLKPLLVPLALHEQFLDADYLEGMSKQVDEKWTREKIDRFCTALAAAGLLTGMTQGIFKLHPALTGFLRSTLLKSTATEIRDVWSRAFVDVMGSVADDLAPRELHEQRSGFNYNGANFHFALAEAERLKMSTDQSALTQSLATYAQNTRNFAEAQTLFARMAEMYRKAGHKEGEAAAYHQLGMIAEEQRDFKVAEKWYHKSLTINEKLGNEHGAAITYHQLGIIAQEQRDFKAAEKWYLKSLAIKEKQGNQRGAASTYGQMGNIAGRQGHFEESGKWLIKSLRVFIRSNDPENAKKARNYFIVTYKTASDEEKAKLKAMWEEAGLGPLPTE